MRRIAIVAALAFACGAPTGPPLQVRIPEGASLSGAADTLVSRGLLASPRWFRIYARVLGKADEIKAGVYQIPPGLSARRLVKLLTEGRAALRRLVLPEGLMLTEVAGAVSQQLGVAPTPFETAARDPAIVQRVAPGASSLEGYLYPSTYLVRFGATAPELIDQMVAEFEAHWRPEWNARVDSLHMTRHQIVILASIIEEEVRYGPDRPYVSSVYTNRLRRHMRLQADPTVIYALGTRRRLFEKDYLRRSPYNTYLIDGLPPGPIGQPSEESIRAALYPADTEFLYFVAQGDGKHVFSRTLKEHLAAIQAVRAVTLAPRPPHSS
jgi:UPF0755 protein